MMALLIGLIIGFIMCIPVGPINVWVINTNLKKGTSNALAIALGGSCMDLVYFFIILSGLSFIEFKDSTIFYLRMAGIFLIFGLGLKELLSKEIKIQKKQKKETPKGLVASFLLGVIIYTSNPTLIVTMTGLGAFVKSLDLFQFNRINIAAISIGLSVGSFLWFVFLVKVVDRYQEVIRNKYLYKFTKASGALMIGLSIFMGVRLYF